MIMMMMKIMMMMMMKIMMMMTTITKTKQIINHILNKYISQDISDTNMFRICTNCLCFNGFYFSLFF